MSVNLFTDNTFGVVKGAKLTLTSNDTVKSQRVELHKKTVIKNAKLKKCIKGNFKKVQI